MGKIKVNQTEGLIRDLLLGKENQVFPRKQSEIRKII